MTTVLAIEPENEGATAVVIDGNATVRGRSDVAVQRLCSLPGGGLAQDPHALLAAVMSAGRAAAAQADIDIDVITIASHTGAVLAWDPASGRPLSSLVVRADRRAEALCDALRPHQDRILERTGLALDPRNVAPKMAWLRNAVTGDGVVTTLDSWLIHQLTGEFITDAATAGQSLLTEVSGPGWDDEMLRLFGLADERLPVIEPCDQIVGSTIAFRETTAVGGLIAARHAALLGADCLRPGEATCTFVGTEASLLVNAAGTPVHPRDGLTTSAAWRVRGQTTHCVSGQVSTEAVRWMRQLGHIADIDDIDEVAAPNTGGVLAVPALGGLGAPWWRPEARASLSGMTAFTTVGHLVAAIMQGLAAQIVEMGSYMTRDLDCPLGRLRVSGTLSRCRTLTQAIADLMQVEVEVSPVDPAALLGAGALARLAANPTLSLDDAVVTGKPEWVHTPHWSADHAADFLDRWSLAARSA